MSGLRKSSRLRKPISTIDQNLEDDEDDAFITPKPKKSIKSQSNKRPSTDNDEQEMITPKKRQKKKASITTTKTSPYFNTKSPKKKTIKATKKPVKQKKISIDENTTLSNDATSVATKSKSKFI
jgi:hypothetical protein